LQIRRLLDTLDIVSSARADGHIRLFSTLLIGHKQHGGEQRVLSWPFASDRLRGVNRQDYVFIRPPGIPAGAFQLRMDNVWFCKVLLLFSFVSNNDNGRKQHDCAFVSVLEEYTGRRRPGDIISIIHITRIFCIITFLKSPGWLGNVDSKMIYERKENKLVLYVVPLSSILGKLPLAPVGDTGTIPFCMRGEGADFEGASCDTVHGRGDGCRWWYVNPWALSWSTIE